LTEKAVREKKTSDGTSEKSSNFQTFDSLRAGE